MADMFTDKLIKEKDWQNELYHVFRNIYEDMVHPDGSFVVEKVNSKHTTVVFGEDHKAESVDHTFKATTNQPEPYVIPIDKEYLHKNFTFEMFINDELMDGLQEKGTAMKILRVTEEEPVMVNGKEKYGIVIDDIEEFRKKMNEEYGIPKNEVYEMKIFHSPFKPFVDDINFHVARHLTFGVGLRPRADWNAKKVGTIKEIDLYNIVEYSESTITLNMIDKPMYIYMPVSTDPDEEEFKLHNKRWWDGFVEDHWKKRKELREPTIYISMVHKLYKDFDDYFQRINFATGKLIQYEYNQTWWNSEETSDYIFRCTDDEPKKVALTLGHREPPDDDEDYEPDPKVYIGNGTSPIMQCDYRLKAAHNPTYRKDLSDFVFPNENFTDDTVLELTASVTKGSGLSVGGCIALIKSDQGMEWQYNFAPRIPIYLGRVDSDYNKETSKLMGREELVELKCLMGGSAHRTFKLKKDLDKALKKSAEYEFSDHSEYFWYDGGGDLQYDEQGFPHYQGNGLDDVILEWFAPIIDQSGTEDEEVETRYFSHWLMWLVPPNLMRPDRKHDEEEYEYYDSYSQSVNEEYNYQFNPSRYTEEVLMSEIDLIRPEFGERIDPYGKFLNMTGVPALTLLDRDILRVTDQHCGPDGTPVYSDYMYFNIEGVSPLTKKPATHYRPAGISIHKSEVEVPPKPNDWKNRLEDIDEGHLTIYIDHTEDYFKTGFQGSVTDEIYETCKLFFSAFKQAEKEGKASVTITLFKDKDSKDFHTKNIVTNESSMEAIETALYENYLTHSSNSEPDTSSKDSGFLAMTGSNPVSAPSTDPSKDNFFKAVCYISNGESKVGEDGITLSDVENYLAHFDTSLAVVPKSLLGTVETLFDYYDKLGYNPRIKQWLERNLD